MKPSHPRSALAFMISLLLGGIAAADPPDPSAEVMVVRRCLVEYERNTAVSPSAFGVIAETSVEPGARVKAGQILGRLQDDELRAEVNVRRAEAESDVEIRLSEAKAAQFISKVKRTAALIGRNAASREEYNTHRLEAEAASIEVEQAKHRRKLAGLQLEHANALLRTRELVSPHDGVVTIIGHRKGETVAPRDTVFQVVDPDHLRVVGQVDVTEVWRLQVGQNVRIIPEIAGADLPIERESFSGRLAFIDNQIDPLTRTCKVHVMAENRGGLLRAGIEARIEIDPRPPSSRVSTARGNPPRR